LLLRGADGSLANAEWYYGPQKWTMHNLSALYTGEGRLSDNLRIVAAYQDYHESRHNRSFGSSRRTNRFETVNAFSVNIDADKEIGKHTTLYYGGEWLHNSVGSTAYREDIDTGINSGVSTRYPDGSTWSSGAIYASGKFRVHDRWVLHASGRINHVASRSSFDTTYFDFPFTEASLNHTAVNGSLGLIFYPRENWKLFTNLTSGFRAPNIDDIGKVFDSEPGNVVVPNAELEPETAFGIELGSVASIGKKMRLNLSAFYSVVNNAIARGPATFSDEDSILYDGVMSRVLSQQNINRIDVYGVQVSYRWQLLPELLLQSDLSWQHGKEIDAEAGTTHSPAHIAPVFGSSHLVYTMRKYRVDLYANYNGAIAFEDLAPSERADTHLYAKDVNGNPYAPKWWTLNFKGEYNITSNLNFGAGIENIFNVRYRTYASGLSAPGRNFIVSLRCTL
jgi:hemoglobin/transferrin/lactoferrin receptor protein